MTDRKTSLDLTRSVVSLSSPMLSDVQALYTISFPEHERIADALFREGIENGTATCWAYHLGQELVAFTYLLSSSYLAYLFFLAVKPAWQSQGIGTAILTDLVHASHQPLLVTIEPCERGAVNIAQRQRRLRFYEMNGFQQTPYYYQEGTELYHLLTTSFLSDYSELLDLVDGVLQGNLPLKLLTEQDYRSSQRC